MDPTTANSPATQSPVTILVVDDEETIVALCRTILQKAGFAILEATSSPEALKLCKNHQGAIDLLLTDLLLPPPDFQLASDTTEFPYVNGHILAARAAALRKGLRIVLMSGVPERDLSSQSIKRGVLPFVQKPLQQELLLHTIRETLKNPPPAIAANQTNTSGDVDWFD